MMINILLIIFGFTIIFYIGTATHAEKISILKTIIYNMVLYAEQNLGSGTGVAKFSMVTSMFYEKVPKDLRIFINQKQLTEIIESSLKKLKEDIERNTNIKKLVTQ